jgi:hypothetical protein
VRLSADPAPQRGPTWSPDGAWIAYYSFYNERRAVMKARVGSSAAPEFIAYNNTRPIRWSPPGDWIAMTADEKLRIVSPDGKQDRVVAGVPGKPLVGRSAVDEGRRLMLGRIDISTAKETKLADRGQAKTAAIDFGVANGQLPFRGFACGRGLNSWAAAVRGIRGGRLVRSHW